MSQFGIRSILIIVCFWLTACTEDQTSNSDLSSQAVKPAMVGDILLSPSQMALNRTTGRIHITGTSTSGTTGIKPWPNGVIPIAFPKKSDGKEMYEDWQKQKLFDACREWGNRTLVITCVPRVDEAFYIEVTPNSGCKSYVGQEKNWDGKNQANPPPQPLYLDNTNDCWSKRVLMHELGHAIGLFHEHQHFNRDEFLDINAVYEPTEAPEKNAIKQIANTLEEPNYKINFNSVYDYRSDKETEQLTPYDFKSVMHYELGDFYVINKQNKIIGRARIEAKPGKIKSKDMAGVGTTDAISNFDVLAVRKLYINSPTLPESQLTIRIKGTGSGKVDFGNFRTMSNETVRPIPRGTTVELWAIANEDSRFLKFSGSPGCAEGSITMNSDITCDAEFELIPLDCGTQTHGSFWNVESEVATEKSCERPQEGTFTRVEKSTQKMTCNNGSRMPVGTPLLSFLRFEKVTCQTPCGIHPDTTTWNATTEISTPNTICPVGETGSRTKVEQVVQPKICKAGTEVNNGAEIRNLLRYDNDTCKKPLPPACGVHPDSSVWVVTSEFKTPDVCPSGQTGTRTRVDQLNVGMTCLAGQESAFGMPTTSFLRYENENCHLSCGDHPHASKWFVVTRLNSVEACEAPQTGQRTKSVELSTPVRCNEGSIEETGPALEALLGYDESSCQFLPNSLETDQYLRSNEFLVSRNNQHKLIYKQTGNLELYKDGVKVWESNTVGVGTAYMQADGNFVIYNDDWKPLFASNTVGVPGPRLVLKDNGDLVLLGNDGLQYWSTNTGETTSPLPEVIPEVPIPSEMKPGEELRAGSSLVSGNKRFKMTYTTEGDLVLTDDGAEYWSIHPGSPGFMAMQDGNLVIYNSDGLAVWATGTGENVGAHMFMQDDGNLVIYPREGDALWSTETGGR